VAPKAAKKTDTTQVERGKKIISVGQVNRLATEAGSEKRKIKRKAREPVKDKEQTVDKVQRKGKRSRSLPGTERRLKLKGEKQGENQVKKATTRKAPAYRERFHPGNQKQQAHVRQARKDRSEFRN
jgi:hypothetical protein